MASDPGQTSALDPGDVLVSSPRAKLSSALDSDLSNDNGEHLVITWTAPGTGDHSVLLRAPAPGEPHTEAMDDPHLGGSLADAVAALITLPAADDEIGPWTVIAVTEDATFTDEVPEPGAYRYAVVNARLSLVHPGRITLRSRLAISEIRATETSFFDIDRWFFAVIVGLMALALFLYIRRVRAAPEDVFVRRIPGVDAIEEAVGRSTEMGRPVLYVTGVEEIQNIQTIASLLILGHVAEMTAEYDTEIKVANFFPLTMVVAEEIVKQGYANAGRIDAHRPENVMFISAEQFAFAAGVNGLILRDRPATNIYLGRFFAESLILAETGYVTKAIQIGGTAEITQLPFFIAACDYTIIGEELFAVSAYLSREASLLAMLKASDVLKLLIMITVLAGALLATFAGIDLGPWLVP